MRVTVIVLLLAAVLLWLASLPTSAVFVVLLCLLVWYAAPLLAFGTSEPFAAESARIIAIAVIAGLFVAYWVFWLLRKMHSEPQYFDRLFAFGGASQPSLAEARLKPVIAAFSGTLARLKAMRTGARGPGRLFQGKRYLYELPWYIALGSNASGKTTALLRAGLTFPVAGQMQRAAHGFLERTRNVDWWLGNEAVLIDTAGHYTRHGTSQGELPAIDEAQPVKEADAGGAHADAKKKEPSGAALSGGVSPSSKSSSMVVDPNDLRRSTDEAEWQGLLGLLRSHRPRAPINGALLAVDVARLTAQDENARMAEAAALRARLTELRESLGIRFPVYLLITKMDQLSGFAEYFGSLPAEGRAQTWGFTLPYGQETIAREGIAARCGEELRLLAARLSDGVNTRLHDEHDARRRQKLAMLSDEFAALGAPLGELIEQLFIDSRYDDTQLHTTLRGVYFTSTTQPGEQVIAERRSIAQRLAAVLRSADGVTPVMAVDNSRAQLAAQFAPQLAAQLAPQRVGNESYFLHDLLTKVVFPEAHLVRPNLRWEFRFRLLRLIGHALAVLLFVWLAIGLRVSFGHNSDYLDAIERKTQALAAKVTQLYREPKPEAVPDTLTDARYLASQRGLDLSNPDSAYRFGLYTGSDVAAESRRTYDALEDNLLLPQLVKRMESVLSGAIAARDPKTAYDTLRVYLMLHDKAKFSADDVKAWVLDDWARTDSAAVFGGRASMIDHVQQLFSGSRAVQSPFVRNDALIQQARSFLDSSNATERLYERAKAAMQKEAPDEFTLLRAVGPQAGTVFTRESGAPLSRGVPGIFTFDGYRNLFDKRLPEFVQVAREDDAWVMGRSLLGDAQKKTLEIVSSATGADDPLTEAIRRQYLSEYAQQWDAFLGDIRTVSGTSLAFDLQVLRSFAAPDSPLSRLARAAVRETTLAQPASPPDGSLMQKATGQIMQKADGALGIRAEERTERELVDSHFAALREVVTGNTDSQTSAPGGQPAAVQAGKTGLDGVANILNDYYTALTVADNALTNNSMPPASDVAARLKMTAGTMPAPFRYVLLKLAQQGSQEVNHGIGQLLSRQMQAVVGDACRLTIEGNYPFAKDSPRDVSIDDFTRVFAQGGVIDDFFIKTLAPFVDTSARPWRYRTLPGATDAVQGPDLEPFEHAKAIRDVFFGDVGQKQLNWKATVQIPELDPTITGLTIDIDGQTLLYQHGPVQPFGLTWPGPRGGVHAEMTASPRIRPDTSTISTDGPWALMRLAQKGRTMETATPGRTRIAFDFDGRKAVLDIASAGSVANPLTSDVLRTFRCPSSMPVFSLTDSGPPPGLPPAGAPR
ncbi:MAG TPA: type VI secretion system membrane subunit TssM [Paraburkholderia sp.]|uniref:type VI secretion system membrane subunit TssM n=1 Tax=Paraburkholderia sp. TaxID=1926495 RepID=UPI002ECFBB77